MFTFQLASDLHLEYIESDDIDPLDFITPSADILILAGDIGSFYRMEQLSLFMERLSDKFKVIIYVPGNHEWYTVKNIQPLEWDELEKRMYELGRKIKNLHVLFRKSIRIGNICIAGATLWSQPKCKVPPFIVRVHNMRTYDYVKQHKLDLSYIKDMMKYSKKNNFKLLVVSHHPPTEKVLEGANKRRKFISLYATDLDYLLDKEYVNTWVCGHVHRNFDFFSEKGCRVIGNQKGKVRDYAEGYNKEFTFTC